MRGRFVSLNRPHVGRNVCESVRVRSRPSGCGRSSSYSRNDCKHEEDDTPSGDRRGAEATHVHDDLQPCDTQREDDQTPPRNIPSSYARECSEREARQYRHPPIMTASRRAGWT